MGLMKKLSNVILLSSFVLSVLGCGTKVSKPEVINDPKPEPPVAHQVVNQNIGTSGGKVEDGDNVKINVPAGALSANTNISVQYVEDQSFISEKASIGFLGGIEFGPSGTTFDQPVQVSLKLTDKPKFEGLSVFCYDETYQTWDYVAPATYSNGVATFTVDHFSKYEVLDLSEAMMLKFYDLVFEAYLNGKPDSWISQTYKDYLINEKHVMDYYTTYGGYWYEPCGLFVYGQYYINGKDGDQEALHIDVGESNSFGDRFGVSNIAGLTVSREKYYKARENATETTQIVDVTVIVDYKMITPQIELSATENALKKGESAMVYVYTHYAKPSNKLFPDIVLPNYPLSLPLPLDHLYTNKDELTTNEQGKATFVATSRDGEPETIEVNFTVGGYFGTSVSNYISFAKKNKDTFDMTGHISCSASMEYRILDEDYTGGFNGQTTVTVNSNSAGTLDIQIDYDFNGIITWDGDYSYSGLISYTGVTVKVHGTSSSASITSHSELSYHDGQGNLIHEVSHRTVSESYTVFSGGNATINPVNQLGFSGTNVYGFSVCTFDNWENLPTFIMYEGTGETSTKVDGYYSINSEYVDLSSSDSSTFRCLYQIAYGGPIVGEITKKVGTQTITKDNYMKNSGMLWEPRDFEGLVDRDSASGSTTQTLTMTKRK